MPPGNRHASPHQVDTAPSSQLTLPRKAGVSNRPLCAPTAPAPLPPTEPMQFGVVQTEEVPHLMHHGDADLVHQVVAIPRVTL